MHTNAIVPAALKMSMLAAAILASPFLSGCNQQQQAPPFAAPEVAILTVEPQPIVLTTELPGRTAAYRIAEIRPQVNGLIQKRLFTEGADVRAGSVLYQIDPAPYQAALDNAQAALGRSQANLSAVRSRAERYKELLAVRAISQQESDDAAAALQQVEADIRSWEAAVQTARINLAYTKITAPISGRIGRSSVTEGAIVTAYQPVPLSAIQQLDPIYVDVQQSTTELMRLQQRLAEGQLDPNGHDEKQVTIILPDGAAYPLEGTLQFRDVTVDPTTGSVTLRIVCPNPNRTLLPGMFVRALVKEGTNVHDILVPQQAVARTPKGEPYALLAGADDVVQQRPLTLDRAIGNQWLVTAGLAPGDRVIVEGHQRIRPGVKVTVVPFSAQPATGAPAAPHSN